MTEPPIGTAPLTVSLATATPGGGFPVYGDGYPTQSRDIPSVGSWSFIFARTDLSDDTAYRLARALYRGEAKFGQRLPQAAESTAANTWAALADRNTLHPGVARYLRDAGIAR